MWQNVLDWTLDFVRNIGVWYDWLFTPVNINVLAKSSAEFTKAMNKTGLSNFPTWFADIFASASEPIYVTPISIIGVGTLTFVVAVWFLKIIIK